MKKVQTTYLKDYQVPVYHIQTVNLTVDLQPTGTRVTSELSVIANENCPSNAPLILDGEKVELVRLLVDNQPVADDAYQREDNTLTLYDLPMAFVLTIETVINPEMNTDLEGLFMSGGHFCTQCEPHGFRRITYFLDRPDNMSLFKTTIIADKQRYPVLLANGNCIDKGELDEGRHFATWEDPFLKPSYLFALVAGKLDVLEDEFVTMRGKKVDLKLYVDPGQVAKATHAMESLKKSMRWDEDVYGREYDLDIFMIVAVRDFNMGAMENKGLNIFNSKYILADPQSATDKDFENILMVVGHEYFHNWSGNRVTCRDWFQLSLKEGFTVFRDEMFTADHTSEAIKRIDDVNVLRIHQFAEDAGPTAHPIQPQSYVEMNNFYTMTVYNKGAEVVRMLHTLLGEKLFRKATDLYFQRHDGEAVTIEEFVSSMEDAANLDLGQFRLWYSQAGTPELTITDEYNIDKQQYCLQVKQQLSATPGQGAKQAMQIPLAIGLLNQQGEEIVSTKVLNFTERQQCFWFDNVMEKPIPSLLRGFSAPVKLSFPYTDQQLALLLACDTDVFTRYEAGQQYAVRQLERLQQATINGEPLIVADEYLQALQHVATSEFDDKALQALLLTLPSVKYMVGLQQDVDPQVLHQAWQTLRLAIAKELQAELLALYQQNNSVMDYVNNATDNAKRRLKNSVLDYLNLLDNGELAWQQFNAANNMTDKLAALNCLVNTDGEYRAQALSDFYKQWKDNANVMDKWFAVQAGASKESTLHEVKQLIESEVYDHKNPNVIRALVGTFSEHNVVNFHSIDGSGYQFLTEQIIEIDQFNKQVAARLVTPLLAWRQYDKARQKQMRQALETIIAVDKLSKNTYELVNKALAN